MPRPHKSDYARRIVRREIRLTADEDQALERQATERGMTMSDFLRQAALHVKPRLHKADPDRTALIKGLADLGKIGGNVNQIAKALNVMLAAGHVLAARPLSDFNATTIESVLHELQTLSSHLITHLSDGHSR